MTSRIDLARIGERLAADRPVRQALPGWGRVHVDRCLPFLCVYRRPEERDDAGTDRLVLGEAAYVRAAADWTGLDDLVGAVAAAAQPAFGAFLLVEVWADERLGTGPRAAFAVHAPQPDASAAVALARALGAARLGGKAPEVELVPSEAVGPPGLAPLAVPANGVLGLAVAPIHRDARGRLLPAVLAQLQRAVGRALKEALFVFVKEQTPHHPPHHHALGRRAVTRAVWEADRRLAAVGGSLDFMLMVTPVNTEAAWRAFRRSKWSTEPMFRYRPWPGDPARLLHDLYSVPVQRVEDPTLRDLFEQKRVQLGRKLAMLRDRGTPAFLYGSLQVYGGVDEPLLSAAQDLLARLDRPSAGAAADRLDATAFAVQARDEIARYRSRHDGFTAEVKVRRDVPGMMASHGNLLVSSALDLPVERAMALLQHEVGTHLLCHYNARAQPFRLLRLGLPGYDDLQEGLAVMAEHLVGGLGGSRLRILAARVIAVRRTIEGAGFKDLFAELREEYGFGARTAFMVAMRSLRGGGFTRDAAYLRGLRQLLGALAKGASLESLYVGKISLDQLAMVEELQLRGVLRPTPQLPVYLDTEPARQRLDRLREHADLMDLCEEAS